MSYRFADSLRAATEQNRPDTALKFSETCRVLFQK